MSHYLAILSFLHVLRSDPQKPGPKAGLYLIGAGMKRDLSVIRYILRKVEDVTDYELSIGINRLIEEYVSQPGKNEKDGTLMYASFKMLQAEKFILTGNASQNTTTGSISWETIKGITWRGYNLIDAIDNGRALEFV